MVKGKGFVFGVLGSGFNVYNCSSPLNEGYVLRYTTCRQSQGLCSG